MRYITVLAFLLVSCTPALDTSPTVTIRTDHATIVGHQVSVGEFLADNHIDKDIELIARTAGRPPREITFILATWDEVIQRCRSGINTVACNKGGGVVYLMADAPRYTVLEEIAHGYEMDEWAAWELRCKAEWRQAGCRTFERY